jgi:phosphoglycerate dehydrogenase-like enzyme
MTLPRVLVSAHIRSALGDAVDSEAELVALEDIAGDDAQSVDAAFISRDITGLSTKTRVLPPLQACYRVLRRSPGLRWVHSHSAGVDRPIYAELMARGVQVSTSSGANAEVVAQTALAGVLALSRRLPQLMAAQRERRWAPLIGGPWPLPRDLAGQTAVLLGWGPIARALQPLLALLKLHVVVVRQSAQAAGEGIETVAFDALHSVLPRADWLLLACPLTAATRGCIDAAALQRLPHGAHLVNVARGEIVVETDLMAALQSGTLAGAMLDVFETEPLPEASLLWSLPNVIITPHSAGQADGNAARTLAIFVDNLRRWRRGRAILNLAGAVEQPT